MSRWVVLIDKPEKSPTVTPASITVTEHVFEMLDERGFTPEWLADASGISCVRLGHRLNLKAPWSLADLEGLSEAFDFPLAFWLAPELAGCAPSAP